MWPVTFAELLRMAGVRRNQLQEYIWGRFFPPLACKVKGREELYDAEEALRIVWADQRTAADKSAWGIQARGIGLMTMVDLVAFAEKLGLRAQDARNCQQQKRLPIADMRSGVSGGLMPLYDDDALVFLREYARDRRERASRKANELAVVNGENTDHHDPKGMTMSELMEGVAA